MIKPEAPFYLVTLCQVLALILQGRTVLFTAREGIAAAALLAIVQMGALWLLRQLPRRSGWPAWERFCGLLVTAALVTAAGTQIVRMSMLCRRELQAGGMWVLLLVLCLCRLPVNWHALCRMSQALWVLAALTGLLLLGLIHRMNWHNLDFVPLSGERVGQAMAFLAVLPPELLALPWVPPVPRRFCWKLPLMTAGLECSFLVAAEAIFGWQAAVGRWPALDGVRGGGLGPLVRADALFLGLWLVLSLYRVIVLWQLICRIRRGESCDESKKSTN